MVQILTGNCDAAVQVLLSTALAVLAVSAALTANSVVLVMNWYAAG